MSRPASATRGGIQQLAHLYGVQAAYRDVAGRRQRAAPESLLATLKALGAPVEGTSDVPEAMRERRQKAWQRGLEPVVVAWDGGPAETELRLPARHGNSSLACELSVEQGEVRQWRERLADLPCSAEEEVEGVRYRARRLSLPEGLPWGYHELRIEAQGRYLQTLVISAPTRAHTGPPELRWGAFLPLYAMHTERSWGAGDFSDLEALMEWIADLGGGVVATLPFLATYLDEPYDPSPYAPVSRLFWNEFYVDAARLPEVAHCPAAQRLLDSPEAKLELRALRSSPLVEYRRQMALKREVLEELARCFFAGGSQRSPAIRRFLQERPDAEVYARFRAVGERRREPWPEWPSPLRDGVLAPGDYGEDAARYHLYAQWAAHEQVQGLSQKAEADGLQMYLDLPLGVHPHGYDTWRERDLFAADVSAGAPPDAFFPGGQNWGFPPLHPERLREQRHRYVISYLRHHLRHARLLRIDHVMSLHRLFWIPKGLDARDGVYVHYPAEELYAILSLESHRHGAAIVGENLGTVPSYVNSAMTRHNLQRMYVVPFELGPGNPPLGPVPRNAVASLNTHDLPHFAAYWQEHDIDDRLRLGLVGEAEARKERRYRRRLRTGLTRFLTPRCAPTGLPEDDTRVALTGCLRFLASSRARTVLLNLEDLWLESGSQNVPGTSDEYPNWRRRARHGLDQIRRMPEVRETLQEVNRLRKRAGGAA